MCGRYTVFTEDEITEMRAIIAEVSRRFGEGAVNTGEIRPTNTAPILVADGDRLSPQPVAWGFPKWRGSGVHINARTDTILHALRHPEKRSIWRDPVLTRRCVIPSTGFYEWGSLPDEKTDTQLSLFSGQGDLSPREKVKLHFRRPGESMLYMAGVLDTIPDSHGQPKDVFAILTTEANDSMRSFHDRMPVILAREECEQWVRSEPFLWEVLAREGPGLVWEIA
jgi:putative SOS response-associated peptidase YedK